MTTGRFNVLLGLGALVAAAFVGFALGQTLDPYYGSGYGQIPLWRYLTKAGHTHGMLIGLVNIVLGLLIGRPGGSERLKRYAAVLTALSLCLPVGVALRGLTDGAPVTKILAMAGGTSFLAACVLMMVLVVQRKNT